MRRSLHACVAAVAALLLAAPALAVPSGFTYTGELWAENGLPYQGAVDVQVSVFGAGEGGEALWTGDLGEVWVTGGVLSVKIDDASLPTLLGGSDALWLEFTIDAETLAPRQRLTSVPYAHVAGDAATVGGMPASAFAPAGQDIDASQLPTDGVGAISNGALSNAFQDVSWSWDGAVDIIDFPAPAAQTTLNTSETGNSYLTGLAVFTKFQVGFNNRITVTLTPPPSSGVGAIVLIDDESMAFGTYSNAWTPGNTPALTALLGQKVEGTWTLAVQDNDLSAPAGTVVGQILEFNVTYDVVRSDHMQVAGRLDVDGDLDVGGMVLARGGLARKVHWSTFTSYLNGLSQGDTISGRQITFTKAHDDTGIEIRYQDTLRCMVANSTSSGSCRIELKIDGQSCTSPGALRYGLFMDPAGTNHHRPQTITAYCNAAGGSPIAAGSHTITIDVTSSTSGASFGAGWDNARGFLAVEEFY